MKTKENTVDKQERKREIANVLRERGLARLLTVDEAAGMMGVSICTIYRWAEANTVPHLRLGRTIRFMEPRLLEWIEERAKPGASVPAAQAQ